MADYDSATQELLTLKSAADAVRRQCCRRDVGWRLSAARLAVVVWRCVYSFHFWGVTLYTLHFDGGDAGSVDIFVQHSQCWMHTVLQIFLSCDPSKSLLYFDSKPHIRVLLACYSSNKIICIMFIGYVPPPITIQLALTSTHCAQNMELPHTSSHPPIPNNTFPSFRRHLKTHSTTFTQPILYPSSPHNAPWFSSETLSLNKSLAYLLTLLVKQSYQRRYTTLWPLSHQVTMSDCACDSVWQAHTRGELIGPFQGCCLAVPANQTALAAWQRGSHVVQLHDVDLRPFSDTHASTNTYQHQSERHLLLVYPWQQSPSPAHSSADQ